MKQVSKLFEQKVLDEILRLEEMYMGLLILLDKEIKRKRPNFQKLEGNEKSDK